MLGTHIGMNRSRPVGPPGLVSVIFSATTARLSATLELPAVRMAAMALMLRGSRSATACVSLRRSFASYTGRVTPGKQSPTRRIPAGVARPDYADDGEPKTNNGLLPGQARRER